MKFTILCCLLAVTWLNAEARRNPMMNPGMFEGDMLGVELDGDRNAIPRDSQRWPNGVIPYIVDSLPKRHTKVLYDAMKHIENNTCIRFVPRTNEMDYVKAFYDLGCYAHWGRLGIGEQKLSLGPGCADLGTGIHELMHAIGFEHEHNRSDRDSYITIYWENIPSEWRGAFKKLKPHENRLLTSFDYDSIMLYGSSGFDDNDPTKLSMVKIDGEAITEVYDRFAMSKTDILRVKMLYDC